MVFDAQGRILDFTSAPVCGDFTVLLKKRTNVRSVEDYQNLPCRKDPIGEALFDVFEKTDRVINQIKDLFLRKKK